MESPRTNHHGERPPTPLREAGERGLRERRERAVNILRARLRGLLPHAAARPLRGAGFVASGAAATWAGANGAAAPGLGPAPASADPLEALAIRLDATAYRLAHGLGALDLAIGETLRLLFADGGLAGLGWKRQIDFARGRLGIPARTMYHFLELAQDVADLPELRLAVIRGEISGEKARLVAPALRKTPDRREFLLLQARTRKEAELRQILAELGESVPKDPFLTRAKRFRMAAKMQEQYDAAIELAKTVTVRAKPEWVYAEVMAMEFLAAHAERIPEPVEEKAPPPPPRSVPPSPRDRARLLAEWESGDTREIEEAILFLLSSEHAAFLRGEPVEPAPPRELEARLLRLLDFRKRRDEPLGRILETVSTLRLHTFFGYSSFAGWAQARIGISERQARDRVWLERRMEDLPAIRMALESGRLSLSKAMLVAKDATKRDVAKRIEEAARTSWQQTRRKSDEKEHRQNLAAGIRRIWGPEAAMETIETAIRVAKEVYREKTGLRIGDGEALEIVAKHFEAEWRSEGRRRRLTPLKRIVFARTKGICAAPECSNAADHMHHIIYRSNQGPDEAWNGTFLCFTCHRKVHKGLLQVSGRGGERLVWHLWRGVGRWEIWETTGDDDVRYLGEVSPPPGTAPGWAP